MAKLNQDNAFVIQDAMVAMLANPSTGLPSANSGAAVDISNYDKDWQTYRARVDPLLSAGLSQGAIVWIQYQPQKPESLGSGVTFGNKDYYAIRMGCPILDQNWPVSYATTPIITSIGIIPGNATSTAVTIGAGLAATIVPEVITGLFTDATHFTVTGSQSGSFTGGAGVLGVLTSLSGGALGYAAGTLKFTVTAGSDPMGVGDTIVFEIKNYKQRFDNFRIKLKSILFGNRTMNNKTWFLQAWDKGYFVEKAQKTLFVMDFICECRYTSYVT